MNHLRSHHKIGLQVKIFWPKNERSNWNDHTKPSKMKFTSAVLASMAFFASTAVSQTDNLVEVVVGRTDLATLAVAVGAADLIDTLSDPAVDFTLFGPNNDAFADLPEGLLDALVTAPWVLHLTDILLYHVTAGTILAADLTETVNVTMANSELLTVTVGTDGGVGFINGDGNPNGAVIETDLLATNGVLHIADSVLLPSFVYRTVVSLPAQYSTLLTAIELAGLTETLMGDGPFTVFGPSNAAFAALPDGTLASLTDPANVADLTAILTYHVLSGVFPSVILTDGAMVPTLNGAMITIGVGDGVTVNDATVDLPNYLALNGIVHGIDAVLIPPPNLVEVVVGRTDLATLATAVTAAGLIDTLSDPAVDFTLFGPNNDAFADLPEGLLDALVTAPWVLHLTDILLYHATAGTILAADLTETVNVTMVNGELLTVTVGTDGGVGFINGDGNPNGAVIETDLLATNGVLHIADSVLLPSFVYRTVVSLPAQYSTLLTAIELAGLTETLMGDGPFTVFGPSNAAFAALPDGTLASLTDPANVADLTAILTYHVLSGVFPSVILTDGAMVPTLNGAMITIGVGDGVTVNDATVDLPDYLALNGIVHGIDAVLIPPIETGAPTAAPTDTSAAFGVSALVAKIVAGLFFAVQMV